MYRGGAATMGLGVAGRTVGKREISPAVSDRWGRRRSEASVMSGTFWSKEMREEDGEGHFCPKKLKMYGKELYLIKIILKYFLKYHY